MNNVFQIWLFARTHCYLTSSRFYCFSYTNALVLCFSQFQSLLFSVCSKQDTIFQKHRIYHVILLGTFLSLFSLHRIKFNPLCLQRSLLYDLNLLWSLGLLSKRPGDCLSFFPLLCNVYDSCGLGDRKITFLKFKTGFFKKHNSG